jgi:hypothetical protein
MATDTRFVSDVSDESAEPSDLAPEGPHEHDT